MPATATAQSQTFPSDISSSTPFNPIKGHTFNPTPRHIQRRTDLSLGARAVYGYLCSCFGKDGRVHPKLETIAREAGLSSKQQASRCVSELKDAGLIAVIRTGRASYYRFLDPGAGDQPVNEYQADSESSRGESRISDSLTPTPSTPYIENKSPKKQTTPPARRVVVLPGGEDVKACLGAIPDHHRTPSTEKIIRISLSKHSVDDVLLAIAYTNAKSDKNYGAYLNLTLKHNYAEGWTPPAAIAAKETADVQAVEAAIHADNDTARQSADHRAALAENWLKLPESDRAGIRAEYLNQCNRFQLKKARLLDDDRLSQSIGFRLFLEAREAK